MGEFLSVPFTARTMAANKDIAKRAANKYVRAAISQYVERYYKSQNNSFKKFDYDKAIEVVKKIIKDYFDEKSEEFKKYNFNSIEKDRIMNIIRKTAFEYYMKELDKEAFDSFITPKKPDKESDDVEL